MEKKRLCNVLANLKKKLSEKNTGPKKRRQKPTQAPTPPSDVWPPFLEQQGTMDDVPPLVV